MPERPLPRRNGPWTVHASHLRFRNDFFTVQEDEVTHPDGEAGHYAFVTAKDGVCGVLLDAEGNAYLTRQYRYLLERESLEAVAGGIDEGEAPEAAIAREAEEELGIRAARWTPLGRVDTDTSLFGNRVWLFLGRGLSFGEAEREGTEVLHCEKLPFAELVRRVMESEVTHSLTCVAVLKAGRLLEEEDLRPSA